MANLTFPIPSPASIPRVAAIMRGLSVLLVRSVAIASVLAVLLARSRPPVPNRSGKPPRHPTAAPLIIDRDPLGHEALFFDPGTGLPILAPKAGRMDLIYASGSPWRDELGRFQVVGLSNGLAPGGSGEPSLVRLSVPDGEVLDRLPVEDAPQGRPCWSPDLSARILFVDSRGRLARVDFDGAAGQEPPRPATLSWRDGIPGSDGLLRGDISWPADPRLVGRVLVALNPRRECAYGTAEAWWLQLDPDCREIVAAGRLAPPTPPVVEAAEERYPVIGAGPDGDLVLAYLERHDRDPFLRWRLRVAPVGLDPETGAPIARRDEARTLAEGCIGTRPAFSDDGHWVGGVPWSDRSSGQQMTRLLLPRPTGALSDNLRAVSF